MNGNDDDDDDEVTSCINVMRLSRTFCMEGAEKPFACLPGLAWECHAVVVRSYGSWMTLNAGT